MTHDEQILAFEQLYHDQPAVTTPWAPVTDYSWAARAEIERPHVERLIEVFGQGPYLDYGCGPDALLVRMLRDRGATVHGIDPALKDIWRGVLPPRPLEVGAFHALICREVFEHVPLRDILPLVQQFARVAPQFIYITTRYSSEHDIWTVETADTLDPTHITLAAKDFYRLLLTLHGYRRRADLETAMDWKNLGRCLVYERS